MKRLAVLAFGVLLVTTSLLAQYSPTPLQSAASANGNGTTLNVRGASVAVLTVNCAGCDGSTTVKFEATQDDANWSPLRALQVGTTQIASATSVIGVTIWEMPVSGLSSIRARVDSYSGGTVTVTASISGQPWNSKTLDVNVLTAVAPRLSNVTVVTAPPPLTPQQLGNPLLYRAALRVYCQTNLAGCAPGQ